jgi:predicted negative regulator of RcsB-dependent stress response
MGAQSVASRAKRPQQVEPDDAVLARVLLFTEWARKNLVLVGVVTAALVILIAGFFWYRADQARRLDNAAIAFLQVEQAVLSGDDAIASRDLQSFIQQHNGTPYADEARILLAQIHMRAQRVSEAVATLEPVATRLDSPLGPQAALLLATAQEAAGQPQQALETYLRVADEADAEFRRREGLIGAAMLRSQQGDHAGAAELYTRLVEMTEPGSPDRSLFEMRLAESAALAASQ